MWNLMVVEDETIVRIGLRYMLKWESFGVHWKAEASNGEEALRIMDKEEIHIVMTDIRMPGMDGLELARQIKQRNPQVELLFLSGYDNFSYAKEALRLGAADYLHKPTMDEEEVAGTLRKVVTRLEETQAVKQSPAEEDRSEYLLSLLDKYTIPGRPSLPELETEPYREGYVLTVIRKREDAVCDDAESEHLRFLSVRYLVDEFVSKDWGGLVFHRHFREILWLAPAAPPHPRAPIRWTEAGTWRACGIRFSSR
ncbi:response regulator [Paenibacillus sp. P25]|nr:response regulator [Paenibacillus sp. P25]